MAASGEHTHRVRAFRDLTRLPDGQFFEHIAEGLAAIHENAARLADGMKVTANAGNLRSARILESLANEEAGKYLILLDSVRCPRAPASVLADHLSKAGDHLAKGIYADASLWRPASFADVREHVERARPQHYLDGPNNVDWIFRNWIVAMREQTFYVDYVADSDGYHAWWSPEQLEVGSAPSLIDALAFRLVDALHRLGFSGPPVLATVATIWRPVEVRDSMDIHALHRLNVTTLDRICATNGDDAALVKERWTFPLYQLDMRQLEVKQADLRDIQSRWSPEF